MTDKIDEKYKEVIISKIPSARLGEPEDIANAVYYMCSDDAGWVTGEVLTIDGGFLLSGNSMI